MSNMLTAEALHLACQIMMKQQLWTMYDIFITFNSKNQQSFDEKELAENFTKQF